MNAGMIKFAAVSTLAACASLSQASPVVIVNASFENSSVSNYSCGSPVGWTLTTVLTGACFAGGLYGGVFHPSNYQPVGGDPPNVGAGFIAGATGARTAWMQGSGNMLQTLGDSAAAGTYTLSVDVGDRADLNQDNYSIALLVGGSTVQSQSWNGANISGGGWLTRTITWTANAGGGALGIRLSDLGGGQEVQFDNVRLDFAAAVPEPGSLALVSVALLGLVVARRRG